ncbi:MAG: glycoside hydrolase family 127 protein, partial [Acidobacteriota bacterium]|nr:glycoside hydrolase family 127 protein [Acidobacteriota bacterium]
TLIQSVADYVLNLYFASERALYVNMYAPSELLWRVSGMPVKVTQSTDYPESGAIQLRLGLPARAKFDMNFRIPAWLARPARLSVNGNAVPVPAAPRTFARISREWKDGDTVHLELPVTMRTEPIDERHPQRVALMEGPCMMVAVNPAPGLADTPLRLPDDLNVLELKPFHAVRDEVYTTYFLKRV